MSRTACTIDAAAVEALLRKHVQTLEDILLGDCFIICVSLNRHVTNYEKTLVSSISIVGESYIYLFSKSPLLENLIYVLLLFGGCGHWVNVGWTLCISRHECHLWPLCIIAQGFGGNDKPSFKRDGGNSE